MSKHILVVTLAGLCLAAGLQNHASAAVTQSAADGFLVEHVLTIKATPARTWAALANVGAWWNPAHSWSGAAANLSIALTAGSCFCERWSGGSAEHGRVIMARENALLRLAAPLGPLQDMSVGATLTWQLAPEGDHTRLTVTYRVGGDSLHTLGALAPAVDGVIGGQAARLKSFVETGAP